jgi:hypothetical protein
VTRGWLGDQNNGGGDPDDSDREDTDQTPAPSLRRNLVIVGESNPYGADPRFALYHLPRNASGNRLREHLGLRDATYEALEKVNLCSGRWLMHEAKSRAFELRGTGGVLVLLGAKVRAAFGDYAPRFFGSHVGGVYIGTTPVPQVLVSLPHPSGLSRPWHEPRARDRARNTLTAVVPWIPWGETDRAP